MPPDAAASAGGTSAGNRREVMIRSPSGIPAAQQYDERGGASCAAMRRTSGSASVTRAVGSRGKTANTAASTVYSGTVLDAAAAINAASTRPSGASSANAPRVTAVIIRGKAAPAGAGTGMPLVV